MEQLKTQTIPQSEEDYRYADREWVPNPKGLVEVYSNYVHASWGLHDTRVLFGQLKPSLGSTQNFVIEEQVAVTLTWQELKYVTQVLTGMILAYESVNGSMPEVKLAPKYEDIVTRAEKQA